MCRRKDCLYSPVSERMQAVMMGKVCLQKPEEIDAAGRQRGTKWGLAMTVQAR